MAVEKLSDVEFEDYYFSPDDNVIRDFFIPALSNSIEYDRATGYFSSYSLIELSVGVCSLASRNGHIRVITSPRLSLEDIEAIKSGYDLKEKIGESMIRDFDKPVDAVSISRLTLISELIARGILEIKVAIMRNLDQYPNAIFHPKFGIMRDSVGNAVSFTGSLNETHNGLGGNWESVEVSRAFDRNDRKVSRLQEKFDSLWGNSDSTTFIVDMPDVVDELISSYRTGEYRLDLDRELLQFYESKKESVFFKSPDWFKIRPYQEDAVQNWIDFGYHGIFNMATGTGKTKTALCALEALYNVRSKEEGIFTIIVAPQKHLVDQWALEVKSFGVQPIVGHSDSATSSWKDKFKSKVLLSKRKGGNFCLVTTISSFTSPDVQKWLDDIPNLAFILDEAHNMGSELRLSKLPEKAKFRLALSATIERYGDSQGTAALREYFGEECINFPIEAAIGKYLTNYTYHPVLCTYNDDEYSQFINNNERLDSILSDPFSTAKEIEKARRDYIEYSYTLNIQMESKYDQLRNLMENISNPDHFLIYCGKAKTNPEGDFEKTSHGQMVDSIDRVVQVVGKKGVGLDVSRITYRENASERRRIITEFDKGQVAGIVAISCLDEGVDIPSVKTAVFMSSGSNPREYIQRRGRVLRMYPGKDFSEIYDMIVVPKSLNQVSSEGFHKELELKLLAKELKRMIEFSRICLNPEETQGIFKDIEKAYGVTADKILDLYGEDSDD